MLRRTRRSGAVHDEAPEYWITYSDLLVSLLMVFALLLFLTLSKMQREVAAVRRTMRANQRALQIAALSAGHDGTGSGLRFDEKSQTLLLDAEVLFNYGSAALRPEARQNIGLVATDVIPKILNDSVAGGQLQEIVVEGHTDTTGSYMSNLDLSQRRALSVMQAIVENTDGQPYGEQLRRLITASGRSKVEPIFVNGQYDAERSRRIAIHFRFRNEDLLKRLVGDYGLHAE